ncbi:MAG TPA: hypothetical protein VMT00_14520 [Thermoanaerobaculia bacterium]|nr:hypothetical protein [Thermoanaerobaculia bacterium]
MSEEQAIHPERALLIAWVKPLYLDLDGVSRFDEVERLSTIARRLHRPASTGEALELDLLLLFSGLASWLSRVGNLSRTALALRGVVSEDDLRRLAARLKDPGEPATAAERAVAAARLVDRSGLRALLERLSRARREGSSLREILEDTLAMTEELPAWLPDQAAAWVASRQERTKSVCRALLDELEHSDLR